MKGSSRAVATFSKFASAEAVLDAMKSMTPSEIATALERTRASLTRKTADAYNAAIWIRVERAVINQANSLYASPNPFVNRSLLLRSVVPDADYYVNARNDAGVEPEGFPFKELSACLHYFAYVSNVFAYVAYKMSRPEERLLTAGGGNQEIEQRLTEEYVRSYHAEVDGTLAELKAAEPKVLTVNVITRTDRRNINNKLFYRLFGEKALPGPDVPCLYLPVQYLFHEWTSINLDGRAFKLFLTMPEFTWASVKHGRVLSRVRVSHEKNALSLNVSNLAALSVISVQDGPLLSRARASFILGSRFADTMRNLTELSLVNLPSAVFPENVTPVTFPRLQLFHIENVSRGRNVMEFISQVLVASQSTLKTLVLAGPDLLVDRTMQRMPLVPRTVRSLTIKRISVEVDSFPRTDSIAELDDLTLADLPVSIPDAQYRLLAALSPKELVLESLPLSNASFTEMLRAGDPDRLQTLKLINMNVFTLDGALDNKRELTNLSVMLPSSSGQQQKLSVPIRSMARLTKFTIGGVEAENAHAHMTGATFSEWMRQKIILGGGGSSPGKEPKRRLSFESEAGTSTATASGKQPEIERNDEKQQDDDEEKDSVSFEAIEQTLMDMYEPFGSKGAGQYPERLPPAKQMETPGYPLAGLLMQTWLEWDEGIVAWLANEHGEGLLLDSAMGDIVVSKKKVLKDGDVYAVEFSSKRSMQKVRVTTGARPGAADEKLSLETEKFWNDLDSVTVAFPMRFELACKERVIGRSATSNAPIIDGSVHLLYSCKDTLRFSTGDPVERDSSSLETQADFLYFGQRIGKLIRQYETTPSGFRFIVGFKLRLVLGQAVRMLATEDALLLSTRSIAPSSAGGGAASGKASDAAAAAESLAEASAEGLPVQLSAVSERLQYPGMEGRFSGEEIVRHRVLTNILYTTSAIVSALPFKWDEDNDQVLAAIQQEPERVMFGNWFNVAYCFCVGLGFVLESAGYQSTELRAHWKARLQQDLLLPVARWCLAYSPADRITQSTVSSEESLISVEAAGDRLLAIMSMIETAVLDKQTPDEEVVSVTTMLSPPTFGADDEDDENAAGGGGGQEDESVMQFVQAQADFEDAINHVLDNEHASSAQFEQRVGQNRRAFINATKRLTDIYLEAQANHSGGGRFLDFAQMAAFMRAEYGKSSTVFDR